MRECEQLWKCDAVEAGGLSPQDAASFERHARMCRECRERVAQGRRLRELVDELPARSWSELSFRRARARLLGDAHGRTYDRPSRTRGWLAFAALAISALVVFLARRPSASSPADPWSGVVTPEARADWSRARAGATETVHLTAGRLHVVVRKQRSGERFRIETPDGELEVRGTTFDVEVSDAVTRRVEVREGLVAVRLQGRAPFDLAAGQAWERPSAAAEVRVPAPSSDPGEIPVATASPAMVAPPPPVVQPPTPRRPTAEPSAETADYATAMAAYQGGRYDDAAAAFRAFSVRHRDSSLNEDATFLEAVSLTRAGRGEAGAAAAWRHLAEFPASFHAKEASILVARAARDRGDCPEARRTLARFMAEGSDGPVREALGRCYSP